MPKQNLVQAVAEGEKKLQQPSFLRLLTELDLKPRMATTQRLLESPVLPLLCWLCMQCDAWIPT